MVFYNDIPTESFGLIQNEFAVTALISFFGLFLKRIRPANPVCYQAEVMMALWDGSLTIKYIEIYSQFLSNRLLLIDIFILIHMALICLAKLMNLGRYRIWEFLLSGTAYYIRAPSTTWLPS